MPNEIPIRRWVIDVSMGGPPFWFRPMLGSFDTAYKVLEDHVHVGNDLPQDAGYCDLLVALWDPDRSNAAVQEFYRKHHSEVQRLQKMQ